MTVAPSLALRAELARKALHLGTAVLPIAWGLGLLPAATIRVALAAATLVAFAIEFARRVHAPTARRFLALTGRLLRAHENTRLTGATWLALAMTAAAWLAPEKAAIAALWAAAVGDATAAIVGRSWSAYRGSAAGKTPIGSLALLAATAVGAHWLTAARWPVAFALGFIAAAVEWPRIPMDDNLRVTAAVAIAATLLGLR